MSARQSRFARQSATIHRSTLLASRNIVTTLSAAVTTHDDSLLWTLEEISRLVSHSGHPQKRSRNIVQLIQRTLRHRCLLGLSARARSLHARARRHGRAPPGQRRPRAHAVDRGAGRAWSASSYGLRWWRTPPAPALQVLQRGRRRPVSLVPRRAAHRSRTCCRACSSFRPIEARAFSSDAVRMLTTAGAQLASIVSERAHARPVRRAGASAARSAGAEPVVELGPRHGQPVPRARSGAVARARSQPDRAASADSGRSTRRAGLGARCCTAASTTRIAACRST